MASDDVKITFCKKLHGGRTMTLSLRNAYRNYRKRNSSVYVLRFPACAGQSDTEQLANAILDMRRRGGGGIIPMPNDYSYEPIRDSWLDRFWAAKHARS